MHKLFLCLARRRTSRLRQADGERKTGQGVPASLHQINHNHNKHSNGNAAATATTRPGSAVSQQELLFSAFLTLVGMTLHNLPEGMAVALSAMRGLRFGVPVALAIGLHNIPEGTLLLLAACCCCCCCCCC